MTISPKMKILHCIPSLDLRFGGPSQSTASLISAIAGNGWAEVSLFYEQGGTEAQVTPQITRIHAPMWRRRFWVPGAEARARLRVAVRQADVVHLHSYWNIFAAQVLAEAHRAGRPVVLSPRGCLHRDAIRHSSQRLKQVFRKIVGNRQLARVAGYHFQSAEEAINSITGARSAPAPAVVIDNGVDIPAISEDVAEARRRLTGADTARVNLLFLGRLNRIKGIDLQIRALRHLVEAGHDTVLNLVGPDDGESQALMALARELDVADRIRIRGPVYAVDKTLWLRLADVVLMSSEFENNSNVALEVMATGGILVATDSSIGPTAAEAGAVIRVARSAEALTAGVLEALSAPDGGDGRRQTAQRFVTAHHDWTSRAARMVSFYRDLT